MHLMWFRRDLRINDNTALTEAIRTNEPVIAVFFDSPQQWQQHELAPIQADLIYRRLEELKQELADKFIPLLFISAPLYSDIPSVLQTLCKSLNVRKVWANKDYELDETQRDAQVTQSLANDGVECVFYHDKCLLPPESVKNKSGTFFKVFTPFKNQYLSLLSGLDVNVNIRSKIDVDKRAQQAIYDDIVHNEQYRAFLGEGKFGLQYPRTDSQRYTVKTSEIKRLLTDFIQSRVIHYDSRRDFPSVDGTSQLSPYLAIGALNVRQCLRALRNGNINGKININGTSACDSEDFHFNTPFESTGGQIWLSELIWRDFYQHLQYHQPTLSKRKSFHDWGYYLQWDRSPEILEKWKSGQTGYPIVDAAMRQLNHTGWMHNRLRMVVASFLVKDCLIDWRKGESYFMQTLIDGDYAANNGGWQWCASTGCDGQPYFRIFNPTSQSERFDAEGEFIRRWVPELAPVPNKYVHTPSKWVEFDSTGYPLPIVDHAKMRKEALLRYKQAKDFHSKQ
ncbi:deoxyribodipyrimidine photo-lyase [Vibrio sp.]|nr:deoxyribodipyrimidine photo-lyase [Vibrio sp.]